MEWIIHLLRQHSELAIFLTIAAGFWIGKMKIKQSVWDRHQCIASRGISGTA